MVTRSTDDEKVIIIPSSHIFEMSNQKVINNQVDSLFVDLEEPRIINTNETVYDSQIRESLISNKYLNEDVSIIHYQGDTTSVRALVGKAVYVGYKDQQYMNKSILIPISEKNHQIKELTLGLNDNNATNIKYSITGILRKGNVSSTGWGCHFSAISAGNIYGNDDYITKNSDNYIWDIVDDNDDQIIYNIPQDIENESSIKRPNASTPRKIEANTSLIDYSNIATVEANKVTINNKDYFELDISVLCGIKVVYMEGSPYAADSYAGAADVTFAMQGTYEEYIPKYIDITVKGDIISLDLHNKTIKIDNGESVYSFSGNEIMQTTNSITPEEMYQQVIDEWKDGKETATIRCDMGDFYGNKGSLLISPYDISKPIGFTNGDICIPYVYGVNGKDRPMSIYADGSPKKFQVISTNAIYDGSVWQELVLQEVAKSTENI